MTSTIERPRTELKVPPGLFVPEIENDLARREFLIGAGGLLVLAPGRGNGGETGKDAPSGVTRIIEPTDEERLRRLAEGQEGTDAYR